MHTLQKLSVLHPQLFSWQSTVVFFPSISPNWVRHFCAILRLTYTALPNPGWMRKFKKKRRCLSFFYRIILPSDLVLLKRMSYNVTEVLSLFYFIMFCMRNVSYFLHSTHKQNSISALHGEEPPLMFSLMATLCCNTLQLLWLASALISLHICFS